MARQPEIVRLRAAFAPFLASGLLACASQAQSPAERAGFVTTLGHDTVALESYSRTATRAEGDLMVRVPATVLFHYEIERRDDGTLARTVIEMHPLGSRAMPEGRVTIEPHGDSARVEVDSGANRRRRSVAVPHDAVPLFMTGFDASYGLYNAIGLYELALAGMQWPPDTVTVAALDPLSARVTRRQFVRRGREAVDADYFGVAWNHLALDSLGRIQAVDATETTEKTLSTRTAPIDVGRLARAFAERDRRGAGLGAASPDTVAKASLGGAPLVITYGSPRLRGRTALGGVVPYDRVWRTGANAATVLMTDRSIALGGVSLPAGSYSLWTIPHRDGAELVVNRQSGQWGTNYDSSGDVAHIPMRTGSVAVPREAFAITLDGDERARTLAIAWDRFVWSVPVTIP